MQQHLQNALASQNYLHSISQALIDLNSELVLVNLMKLR